MGSFDVKLVILSLNLLFVTLLEARPKAHVAIVGNVQRGILTIHCYSGDDDLGIHDLAYNQSFPFNFVPNIWGSTKFFCDFTTQFGSGNYAVYDNLMQSQRCGYDCVWYIRESGPCLMLNPDNKLWCQPWKNPRKWLDETHQN
ncbi:S-protein homolog 5-like [Olea europaea var. sylvestris]|uniref:S-protein homolog 5-like n=1 Tax=Olea europaea var. sylvestris TaxID=158386 RepID=UPI000C1CFDEE|nr:S-protein homolog 5-like [Olea europaea var. sylvestris]